MIGELVSETTYNESPDDTEVSRESNYVTWRKQNGWNPITVIDAEGSYFTDSSGKNYLDLSAQLMCSNLGHKNRNVVNAIKEQAEKLAYAAPGFNTEARSEISRKLREVLPDNLTRFFFSTSGTEANEAAVKMIRMFYQHENRTKIMSMYNSYHGSTSSSIKLTGDFRRSAVDGFHSSDGFIKLPPPYCYRCPFGLKYSDCNVECAEYIDYTIKNEGNVGGLFLEPVTGTNGVVIPPKEYLPRVREITRDNNVFLVADEVMSGWGRTGEWFAINHWGVKPDIMTTAKGLTGAYLPLALTATSTEIFEYFDQNYFAHGHTYEAHPLTLAAGQAAIGEYHRLNLIQKARDLGKVMKNRLEEMKESHISIGDVRSIGLFGAVELVKNRNTKEPFGDYRTKMAGKPQMVDRIAKSAMEKGVYVNAWISHFVIAPPLTISEEELMSGLDVLDECISIADAEADKQ